MDFLQIRPKNVEYFILVHAHKPKFWLFLAKAVPKFFLAPFFSFFPARLLSLLSTCHFLSGCRKKFGVNYWQSLDMGSWSIIGIRDHFIMHICAPKLITLFSKLLRQNVLDIQKQLLYRYIYCRSTIYLSKMSGRTFKSMKSQVEQRERPSSGNIWLLGYQGARLFIFIRLVILTVVTMGRRL